MAQIDSFNPFRIIRNIINEWYERREAREIFLLLEELELPNDYEPTPDLPVRILQRVEQYEAEKRASCFSLRHIWHRILSIIEPCKINR